MPHVAAVGNLWRWCIILFARSSLTNCQTNLCLVWIFDRVHFKLLAPFLPHVFQHSTKSLSSGSKGHLHREEDPVDDQVDNETVVASFLFFLLCFLANVTRLLLRGFFFRLFWWWFRSGYCCLCLLLQLLRSTFWAGQLHIREIKNRAVEKCYPRFHVSKVLLCNVLYYICPILYIYIQCLWYL